MNRYEDTWRRAIVTEAGFHQTTHEPSSFLHLTVAHTDQTFRNLTFLESS